MTLTPPRFHIADDMPMSLGKAIAREIAPKPFNHIAAFHEVCFDFVIENKGAAPESKPAYAGTLSRPASTDAAPPSVQKFKVGDKFRVKEAFAYLFPINEFVANQVDGDEVWAIDPNGNANGFFWAQNIELISPASETETEGWVTWTGGKECPVPEGTLVLTRRRDGKTDTESDRAERYGSLWVTDGSYEPYPFDIVAYRVVKP